MPIKKKSRFEPKIQSDSKGSEGSRPFLAFGKAEPGTKKPESSHFCPACKKVQKKNNPDF